MSSLLGSLLELTRQAEGRRVETRNLLEAVGRVVDAILKDLREGDHVVVDGRTYVVETRRQGKQKVLTIDKGILGPRERDHADWVSASVEDNVVFASNATRVLEAFADQLREQRTWLSDATGKASTKRP